MIKAGFSVKDILKLPLFSILFLLLTFACDGGGSSGGGDPNRIFNPNDGVQNPLPVNFAPASGSTWTIMVYLDGDNDLEPFALIDFQEMKTGMAALGDTSEHVNLIVMIDRCTGYSSAELEGSNFTDTRYYQITRDGATRLDTGGTGIGHVPNLGEKNMGDPATLTAFLNYCKANFSAKHYALIFWNHGGGSRSAPIEEPVAVKRGVVTRSNDIINDKGLFKIVTKAICWDETDGDDCLYLDEVQQALIASGINSSNKLDIIAFDACLMGTVEVAFEFRDLAHYMVGSMNTEWGHGWDYNRLFRGMTGGSSDASELAILMVEQYRDSTINYSSETQSAIDLSKITGLKTAINAFAVKLAYEGQQSKIESTRDLSYHFYTSEEDSISHPYYDLGDFAYQIYADWGYSANLRNSANTVITKLSEAVVYAYANTQFGNYYGSGLAVKRGLSIFFSRGDLTYSNSIEEEEVSHYAYQWWYTSRNTVTDYGSGYEYGEIDFCNFNDNKIVETWKELMEYFYGRSNTLTIDTY